MYRYPELSPGFNKNGKNWKIIAKFFYLENRQEELKNEIKNVIDDVWNWANRNLDIDQINECDSEDGNFDIIYIDFLFRRYK